MSDWEFTEKDFEGMYIENKCCGDTIAPHSVGDLVNRCNARLKSERAKCPVVEWDRWHKNWASEDNDFPEYRNSASPPERCASKSPDSQP